MISKQENFLVPLNPQLISKKEYSGEAYREISLYAWDDVITEEEASVLVAECKNLFNIDTLKTKYFLVRVLQKGWSKKQFEDAIAHAFDTNKIPTKNVGMEPGVILSYERNIRVYSYADKYTTNERLVHTNIKRIEGHYWLNSLDYQELEKRGLVEITPEPSRPYE